MAYDHKALRHKNDPRWVKNLNKYIVPAATERDVKAVDRNYDGDKRQTTKAAYAPPAYGEDD